MNRNPEKRGVEDLEALWEALPDRAPEHAPTAVWPLVRSQLGRKRLAALPRPVPRWRMATSFAAGVLVGVLAWSLATGGPSPSAAEEELLAQESLFQTFDPIPPESVGGRYFAAVPVERDPNGGPQ